MVREVKGIEKMSMLGAGRGARERGGRRLEVEVNSKRRSPSHDVSNLVLETVEESCAFGEDIVLVGLRYLTRQSKKSSHSRCELPATALSDERNLKI